MRLWNLLPPDEPVYLDVESSSVHLAADERSCTAASPTVRSVPSGRSRCLRGHTGPVYAATFLPGDCHLVSVSEDTTVRLWDRTTGAGLAALHGHVYPVWCVAADCLGVNFVTGSHDRTARLWRPEVAHPLRIYSGHEGDVDCVREGGFVELGDCRAVSSFSHACNPHFSFAKYWYRKSPNVGHFSRKI